MTEPQGWVQLGLFGSLMIGGFTLQSVFFDRQLRRTRGMIVGKLDALDRDVQAIAARVFRREHD